MISADIYMRRVIGLEVVPEDSPAFEDPITFYQMRNSVTRSGVARGTSSFDYWPVFLCGLLLETKKDH